MQKSGGHYENTAGKLRGAVALSLTALLIQACMSGDLTAVVSLITEKYVNPCVIDEFGRTPLKVACEGGHIDIVKYLIEEQGVDPASRGRAGRTSLHYACKGGHLQVVMYLVTNQRLDPNLEDNNGDTPLHYARSSSVVAFLADYCDINHRNKHNHTLLHDAATNGLRDIVEYLVRSRHCDPACKGGSGRTPLHYASAYGHIELVKYLSNRPGVDSASREDVDGGTPLHYAKNREIAGFLVERGGCDVNHRNHHNNTPLHDAAYKGQLDVVKYLIIKQRCDPACRGKDGWTPLHYASAFGHSKLVVYLINEQEVDPSCKDYAGTTPLDHAHSDEIAQFLKKAEIDSDYTFLPATHQSQEDMLMYTSMQHLDVFRQATVSSARAISKDIPVSQCWGY